MLWLGVPLPMAPLPRMPLPRMPLPTEFVRAAAEMGIRGHG